MRTSNKLIAFLFFVCIGCADNKLSKEEAAGIIKKEYPRVVDTYIYAGDPKYAVMLHEAGLDREGYVTIKKTKKFGDTTGWVSFTEKSNPYFLETSEQDKKDKVQKIKAATEDVSEIISIEPGDGGNTAVVTFQTRFTEITPFGKVIKLKADKVQTLKAYFIRNDNGWRWEKRLSK